MSSTRQPSAKLDSKGGNPDVGVAPAATSPTACPTIDAASLARLVEDAHRQEGRPEVAHVGEESVQRGLVESWAA